MFIDSSMASPPVPFEGAEDNLICYQSKITPLLRTEPTGTCHWFYRHLTRSRVKPVLCGPFQSSSKKQRGYTLITQNARRMHIERLKLAPLPQGQVQSSSLCRDLMWSLPSLNCFSRSQLRRQSIWTIIWRSHLCEPGLSPSRPS